jgi:hypothetical protein
MRLQLLLAAGVVAALPGLMPAATAAAARPVRSRLRAAASAPCCARPRATRRGPNFDGVPLEMDVLISPAGDGPFPAIAMLHGFAGSKADLAGDAVRMPARAARCCCRARGA